MSRKPETFGRTTLEALSIGTPVVGFTLAEMCERTLGVYGELTGD